MSYILHRDLQLDYLVAHTNDHKLIMNHDKEEKGTAPHRELLVAILSRALQDVMYYDNPSRLIRAAHTADALNWIASDSQEPFSCHWICEHLGFDHNKLIKGVRNILLPKAKAEAKAKPSVPIYGVLRIVQEPFQAVDKDGNEFTVLAGHRVKNITRTATGKWHFYHKTSASIKETYKPCVTTTTKKPVAYSINANACVIKGV